MLFVCHFCNKKKKLTNCKKCKKIVCFKCKDFSFKKDIKECIFCKKTPYVHNFYYHNS